MLVYTFKRRFAPLVKAGTKNQTIRPRRRRRPKVGDEASLREWTGRPYWSKQRVLREPVEVTGVKDIVIRATSVTVDGVQLDAAQKEWLAVADGFASWADMHAWFRAEHRFPFHGELVQWPRPTPP